MGPIDAQDRLVVRLLGDPEVRRGSTLIAAFDSRRLQALLAFLIVGRERAIARQRLAFEFWPDSTDGQARTNLRQALHHLRHALGNGPDRDLAAAGGAEALEDVADVRLDRDPAEPERECDLLVRQPACHEIGDLVLPVGQGTAGRVVAANRWVHGPIVPAPPFRKRSARAPNGRRYEIVAAWSGT
jgi:hypothetical protein